MRDEHKNGVVMGTYLPCAGDGHGAAIGGGHLDNLVILEARDPL